MGVLCMGPEAQAASPIEQLRSFFSAATRILDPQTDDGLEARLGAIRVIVKEIVDVPAAAQLSLGPNWNARTAAEREEFVRLFADLLERSLIGGIAGRIHLPDGIQIRYVGESVDGAVATVWTTLLSKRGLDLPFTYRMIERAGRWAICDVIIDGVSVAANYRAQFFRVMRSSSYQELVRQMRARLPEPLTAPPAATAIGDDVVIVSVVTPPMPASDMTRKESPDVLMRDDLAPRPPGPRALEVDASARSDVRFQLDLDVTLVARALPEAGPCRRMRVGAWWETSRSRSRRVEMHAASPTRWSRWQLGPRPPRTAGPTGCRSAPSRVLRQPGAWPRCSSSLRPKARAGLRSSWSRGRRTFS